MRRQFKLKTELEKRGGDTLWRLLVRKVVSARAMSSLSVSKRKREELREAIHDHGIGNLRF
uniref:BTB/POZ and TAZ domain-containing protein 1-like n=1 Tax=Rhizophora mucronata TaxID=61149 RepID=A0A2P2JY06_RHIMU